MTTAREGELMRTRQSQDAQFGRYPRESSARGPTRTGPATDLAALFAVDNPVRVGTRAAILAALAAGPLSHSELHRASEPGASPSGFFPLALDDLIRAGRVHVEPDAAGGLPRLSLTEVQT